MMMPNTVRFKWDFDWSPGTDEHFVPSVPGSLSSQIKAIYRKGGRGTFVDNTLELDDMESFGLLLEETNFYAEAGGQEHDIGRIVSADSNDEFTVIEVQDHRGYALHVGHMKAGQFRVGQNVTCSYDEVSPKRIVS